MPTADDLIKGARRRESVYRLCLAGDLAADHEAATAELDELMRDGGWTATSLADSNPVTPVADRIKAIEAEMAEHTVTLRFRALKRIDWENLTAAHPPRDGKQEALNNDTFVPALIAATLIDPPMTEAQVKELFESLNQGQIDEVFGTAWAVNTESTSVPFSERASVVTRWREQNSKPLEHGEFPEASSSDV